jgi:hypothetical protein
VEDKGALYVGLQLIVPFRHHYLLGSGHAHTRDLGPKNKLQDDRIQHVSILGGEEHGIAKAISLGNEVNGLKRTYADDFFTNIMSVFIEQSFPPDGDSPADRAEPRASKH